MGLQTRAQPHPARCLSYARGPGFLSESGQAVPEQHQLRSCCWAAVGRWLLAEPAMGLPGPPTCSQSPLHGLGLIQGVREAVGGRWGSGQRPQPQPTRGGVQLEAGVKGHVFVTNQARGTSSVTVQVPALASQSRPAVSTAGRRLLSCTRPPKTHQGHFWHLVHHFHQCLPQIDRSDPKISHCHSS